jgi:hypothetical protein
MSAYAYLIVHDEAEPVREDDAPEGSKLLGANYQVPILWLAMFTASDLRRISLPLSEWGDGVTPVVMPALIARTSDALNKYAERKEAIREALADYSGNIDEWETFIATYLKTEFVQLDFEDLFSSGYDDFEASLLGWLDGIECLEGDGWEDLCQNAMLQSDYSDHLGIRGFPWDADPGWPE